jgi:hypothetical protein
MKPPISGTPDQKPEIPPISRRRQKRIREIQELMDSGWKETEIAEKYGISVRMVEYDIRAGKDLDRALTQGVSQPEIIGKVIRGYEREMRQELRAAQLATNPFAKVAHKRNYIALLERYVKFLQGVGLIDKVADKLDLNPGIDFTDDEVRAAYYYFLKIAKAKGIKNLEL